MSKNDFGQFSGNTVPAPATMLVTMDNRGQGRTIIVDAQVIATDGKTDHLMDFLNLAEMYDYRVVVQSSSPARMLEGAVGEQMRASKRLELFMRERPTSQPILLTGSPEVTMGKPYYLRLTHERTFQPNDWTPYDSRIALNIDAWVQGPTSEQQNVARLEAILGVARDRLKVHRRHAVATRSALFEAMAQAGIDPHAWERDMNNRIDTMRGLGPAPTKNKGPV